jgi:hypothetical protein
VLLSLELHCFHIKLELVKYTILCRVVFKTRNGLGTTRAKLTHVAVLGVGTVDESGKCNPAQSCVEDQKVSRGANQLRLMLGKEVTSRTESLQPTETPPRGFAHLPFASGQHQIR